MRRGASIVSRVLLAAVIATELACLALVVVLIFG